MSDLWMVAIASSVIMLMSWIWQIKHSNAGIVDVVWAFSMMLSGSWYAINGVAPLPLKIVLAALTLAWFCRLGLHLLKRFKNESEDGRYQTMRSALGDHSNIGFFVFFQMQAGFVWVLSLPFWAVAQNTQPQQTLFFFALAIAVFAFWGETSADAQLAEFRKNTANNTLTCRNGWWRYSRHPNYFFEWLHWFAYPLLGAGSDYAYALWFAPLLMFCFLYFFTGIPYTERQALKNRGADYRLYQQTTSSFFPWWPKKIGNSEIDN